MSKAHILSIHCDVDGCEAALQIPDRPTVRATARRAGWVTWTRQGHPLDVCPGCDARFLALLNPTSPVTVMAARKASA